MSLRGRLPATLRPRAFCSNPDIVQLLCGHGTCCAIPRPWRERADGRSACDDRGRSPARLQRLCNDSQPVDDSRSIRCCPAWPTPGDNRKRSSINHI